MQRRRLRLLLPAPWPKTNSMPSSSFRCVLCVCMYAWTREYFFEYIFFLRKYVYIHNSTSRWSCRCVLCDVCACVYMFIYACKHIYVCLLPNSTPSPYYGCVLCACMCAWTCVQRNVYMFTHDIYIHIHQSTSSSTCSCVLCVYMCV